MFDGMADRDHLLISLDAQLTETNWCQQPDTHRQRRQPISGGSIKDAVAHRSRRVVFRGTRMRYTLPFSCPPKGPDMQWLVRPPSFIRSMIISRKLCKIDPQLIWNAAGKLAFRSSTRRSPGEIFWFQTKNTVSVGNQATHFEMPIQKTFCLRLGSNFNID